MFGSDIVDVVIALAFIYFLLSIVASAALESVAQILDWRSKTLKEGVGTLLGDPAFQGLARKVYANPLVKALGTPTSDPSYLKDTRFADALLDTLNTAPSAAEATVATIKAGIAELPEENAARQQLEVLLRQSGDQLDQFRTRIAGWFDEGMDRLSGVYARKSRKVIFAVGLLMAVLFNVDTIATAQALATNPSSRDAIVQSVAGDAGEWCRGDRCRQGHRAVEQHRVRHRLEPLLARDRERS